MSIANNTVNLSEIMTTASDGEGVLGKIVFYGLGGIMIDREEFAGGLPVFCADQFPQYPCRCIPKRNWRSSRQAGARHANL